MAIEIAHLYEADRHHKLAFGVEWYVLPGARDIRKECRALIKDAKASHIVKLKIGNERPLIGLGRGLPLHGKSFSAASLFARHVPEGAALYLVEIGRERVGVVGTRDGRPVIGFDVVVSHLALAALIARFREVVGGKAQLYGDTKLHAGVTALDPAELLTTGEAKKNARLSRARIPVSLIVVGVAVVGLTVAGGVGYQQWKKNKQAEERARRAQVNAQQPVDPNVVYRQTLPTLLETAGNRLDALPVIFNTIRAMPVNYRNWKAESIECEVATVTCKTKWKTEIGTIADLAAHPMAGAKNVAFSDDFNSVTFDLPLLPLPKETLGVREAELLAAPQFRIEIGTAIQKASRLGLGASAPAPAILGLPAGANEGQIRNPIRFGTWNFEGKLHVALYPMEFPKGMTVDKVAVTVTGSLDTTKIRIEGKYYVRG